MIRDRTFVTKIIPVISTGTPVRGFLPVGFFRKITYVIDESHVTIPHSYMYGGDHSRKLNLVEYGFVCLPPSIIVRLRLKN